MKLIMLRINNKRTNKRINVNAKKALNGAYNLLNRECYRINLKWNEFVSFYSSDFLLSTVSCSSALRIPSRRLPQWLPAVALILCFWPSITDYTRESCHFDEIKSGKFAKLNEFHLQDWIKSSVHLQSAQAPNFTSNHFKSSSVLLWKGN